MNIIFVYECGVGIRTSIGQRDVSPLLSWSRRRFPFLGMYNMYVYSSRTYYIYIRMYRWLYQSIGNHKRARKYNSTVILYVPIYMYVFSPKRFFNRFQFPVLKESRVWKYDANGKQYNIDVVRGDAVAGKQYTRYYNIL